MATMTTQAATRSTQMTAADVRAARRAAHLARAAAEYHGWTGPTSRRYCEALAQARQIERRAWARVARGAAVEWQLARQHAPHGWERALLALALLPHRVLPLRRGVGLWSAFWDSWAVGHRPLAERPLLRLGLRRERAHVQRIQRQVWRQAGYGQINPAPTLATLTAADAQWRGQVRALLDALDVTVECVTDRWGSVHFLTRDLTPARRAALTQPSLDALSDALNGSGVTALTRPYDATTQPALPIVKPAVRL